MRDLDFGRVDFLAEPVDFGRAGDFPDLGRRAVPLGDFARNGTKVVAHPGDRLRCFFDLVTRMTPVTLLLRFRFTPTGLLHGTQPPWLLPERDERAIFISVL